MRRISRPYRGPKPDDPGSHGHGHKPPDETVVVPPPTTEVLLGFPHPYVFPIVTVDGGPIWNGTSLDTSYLAQIAKYPYVEMHMPAFTRLDRPTMWTAVPLIKSYNPKCVVAWYWQAQYRFNDGELNRISGKLWDLCTNPTDFRLFNTKTPFTTFYHDAPGPGYTAAFHDLARVKTQTLALWEQFGLGPDHDADGYHFDWAVGNISLYGPQTAPGAVDLTKPTPGYATAAAMNTANTSALQYLMLGMQAHGKKVIGNRGNVNYTLDADAHQWDGELFEGWDPDQGFGASQPPLGYANFDAAMASLAFWRGGSPTADGTSIIKCEFPYAGSEYSTAWNKLARFGLGSATIMGCFAHITPNQIQGGTYHIYFVPDEFAVNASGASDTSMATASMGWLGRPLAYGYKDAGGCWVREFEHGIVVVNGDATTSHSFTLPTTFKRIQGVHDTTVNNGATVSGSLTVPGKDARFLLRP